MKETKIKTYTYKCKCGFVRNVFVDFGVPKEYTRCLICNTDMRRQDK